MQTDTNTDMMYNPEIPHSSENKKRANISAVKQNLVVVAGISRS
jgi:hypothetical protein